MMMLTATNDMSSAKRKAVYGLAFSVTSRGGVGTTCSDFAKHSCSVGVLPF
jgi:hypothetical protein